MMFCVFIYVYWCPTRFLCQMMFCVTGILVSNTIPMSDDVLCIYLRILVSNTIPMSDDVLCIYLRILDVQHDSYVR